MGFYHQTNTITVSLAASALAPAQAMQNGADASNTRDGAYSALVQNELNRFLRRGRREPEITSLDLEIEN